MSDLLERLRREEPNYPLCDACRVEIERLRALVVAYRTAARALASSHRDEGYGVDLRKDYGIDDPDLIDCPRCGGERDLNWGTPEYCKCPDCDGEGVKQGGKVSHE